MPNSVEISLLRERIVSIEQRLLDMDERREKKLEAIDTKLHDLAINLVKQSTHIEVTTSSTAKFYAAVASFLSSGMSGIIVWLISR